MQAIDLFCGAGGFSIGLKDAGIEVILGIDNDESALNTYENNLKIKTLNLDLSDNDANKQISNSLKSKK